MAGYLFIHFIGEEKDGEQIYFSVSKDGLHWKDLNNGKPILYSNIGMCGVRDPFLIRNPRNGKFYIIATDLRIEAGKGWVAAQTEGSRDIIVWESEDLVHWQEERACTVGLPEAGCVWAPEAIYDKEKEKFLVFWASRVKAEGDVEGKHRIYASYTEDFKSYSDSFLYIEKERDVIDTTIVEEEGRYYRFSKDETNSRIMLETSNSLAGTYTKISSDTLDNIAGVEGPECYQLTDGKTWCLLVDRFAEGKGYLPILSNNLTSGAWKVTEDGTYDMGKNKKRHGGILPITDKEYERLLHYFDRSNPVIKGLYADPDIAFFDNAYYIYPTTDGFMEWSGTEFSVFRSEDGKKFQNVGKILDVVSEQVPWAVSHAWAPCITKKDDMYYYYFCAKRKDGQSCIGVASSESPIGPFVAEKEPLITMEIMEEWNINMGLAIDPSIYVEEGEFYLLFGNGEKPAIVKLASDMRHVELKTMKNIDGLIDFREAVTVLKRGGIYHFTWSCDDTRSENYHVHYGTSNSLYGPVKDEKIILEKDPRRIVLATGHHSIVQIPEKDEYYIAYHRFARPLEDYSKGNGWNREICLAPLSFGIDGKMEKVIVL